jgi:hypothetical protein
MTYGDVCLLMHIGMNQIVLHINSPLQTCISGNIAMLQVLKMLKMLHEVKSCIWALQREASRFMKSRFSTKTPNY